MTTQDATNGAVKLLKSQAKRIQELEKWIEEEGERNNTCTHSILKKVCVNCKCGKEKK
jgi:hypothetical protein